MLLAWFCLADQWFGSRSYASGGARACRRMPAGLFSHAESLAAVVPLAGVSVILLGVTGALFAISFVTGGACGLPRTGAHTFIRI